MDGNKNKIWGRKLEAMVLKVRSQIHEPWNKLEGKVVQSWGEPEEGSLGHTA